MSLIAAVLLLGASLGGAFVDGIALGRSQAEGDPGGAQAEPFGGGQFAGQLSGGGDRSGQPQQVGGGFGPGGGSGGPGVGGFGGA